MHDFIKIFHKQYNSNTTTEDGVQFIEINHKYSNVILFIIDSEFNKDYP